VYYLSKINQSDTLALCPGSASGSFASGISGSTYQWQWDTCGTGNCFENISGNSFLSGTNTKTLQLTNIPTKWNDYKFRCVTDGTNGAAYTINFTANWTGAVNNTWETAGNWSCNTVPDQYTDVTVKTGTPILNTSTAVRSIQVSNGANVTVTTGSNLTVTH
jgi:hypothetical protein